jgi:hypothetical protein
MARTRSGLVCKNKICLASRTLCSTHHES